jgi:hypothetical protein
VPGGAADGGILKLCREIQAERRGIARIRGVGQDVPNLAAIPHLALVQWQRDRFGFQIDVAGL